MLEELVWYRYQSTFDVNDWSGEQSGGNITPSLVYVLMNSKPDDSLSRYLTDCDSFKAKEVLMDSFVHRRIVRLIHSYANSEQGHLAWLRVYLPNSALSSSLPRWFLAYLHKSGVAHTSSHFSLDYSTLVPFSFSVSSVLLLSCAGHPLLDPARFPSLLI